MFGQIRNPLFVQTPQIDVASAVNSDYANYANRFAQSQQGGGFGGLASLASLIAAPFTGGLSLGAQAGIGAGLGLLGGGGLRGAVLGGLKGGIGGFGGEVPLSQATNFNTALGNFSVGGGLGAVRPMPKPF